MSFIETAKPLCIDLYAGLFGWGVAFVEKGYRVVGFDIEDMHRKFGLPRPTEVELVLQDVLTLHGSQFKDAAIIVASPPCQFFSYTAMPWKRAKLLAEEVRNDSVRLEKELALFNACFRIQREACEAAGRHISLIVENVCGAQRWVGRAAWHFGSYYLWGDVPALMPSADKRLKCRVDCSPRRFDERIARTPEEAHAMHFRMKSSRSPARQIAMKSSRSPARQIASAQIAKIPLPLARHIAEVYRPIPMCPRCNGSGVIETGNNDMPCDCPAGDVALFNVAGQSGPVTGKEWKSLFVRAR